MSTSWASPRDEFPESVHALMSLWGGFDVATDSKDSGLEKRLEVDFAKTAIVGGSERAPLTTSEISEVLRHAGQEMETHDTQHGLLSMTCHKSILLVTASRIVITSASDVPLHNVIDPLMHLFAKRGIPIEWASFMRKNSGCPWDAAEGDLSDNMAQEYAALKSAFPEGSALLTGPVDGDHFFNFVYENAVFRAKDAARNDTDLQVNVIMFNANYMEDFGPIGPDSDGWHNYLSEKPRQSCTSWSAEEYETLRLFTKDGQPCATYETNLSDGSIESRVNNLLCKYTPDRFTLIAMLDPQCPLAKKRRFFEDFSGYAMASREVNSFTHGYAIHQLTFSKKL